MTFRFSAPPVKIPMEKGGQPLNDTWVQWFSLLYNSVSSVVGLLGGKDLNFPYGSFSNNATQALTLANTPYVCTLDTDDAANGVNRSGSKINVAYAGVYNLQFSLQFENTASSIADVWVWIRKNGVDVAGTASTWAVTSSHGGVNGYMVGACNFFVDVAAGDYLELVAAADATGIRIEAYPSSTSPFARPSIPATVVTLAFVSA